MKRHQKQDATDRKDQDEPFWRDAARELAINVAALQALAPERFKGIVGEHEEGEASCGLS